ncbi:MAG: hypothetical protein CMJ13_03805 [Pelagibacterales bacterium]|nr:hypothetical protein [Pelagibacterales bacterium]
MRIKKELFNNSVILNFFVSLIIFISINIIASRIIVNKKIDLTEDNLFTLSSNTKNILKNLNEQIKIQFFFSDSLSKDIPQIRDFERRVRELMSSYTKLSKNIKLEIFDPMPFTELEDLATSYGIQGLQLNQEGERFYFGAVLTNSVDDMVVIPFFEIARERFLEYDLTKSIFNLANTEKTVIGLISSLPFAGGLSNNPEGPGYQNPFYLYENISEFYEIFNVTENLEKIPDNIDQLLVIHPKNLSDNLLYQIDQFVLSGKGATFFIDPFSEYEITNQPLNNEATNIPKSDLNRLFKEWGLEVQPGMVVGDIINGRKVSLGDANNEKILTYILWLALQGDLLSHEDIITENLDYVFFKSAGSIKNLNKSNDIEFTPLVSTSLNSMLVERFKMQFRADPEALLKEFVSENKSFVLSARVKGSFKSAFSQEELVELKIDTKKHIKKSNTSNIIVFSDTDLLSDITWLTRQDMFGRSNIIPTADNGRLVMNAIESMSGGENLIGLRGRGVSNRPFLAVEDLQKNAELLLKEKEDSLKLQLEETEAKLKDLKNDNFNEENISIEQTQTINDFNKEIFNIRKDLREVQRELGENIKKLEANLKLINIWLMPFLVLLVFYIFKYFTLRRQKSYYSKL